MFAVQPVRIYPGVPICQIFYHEITARSPSTHSDKYQNNHDIQPSLLFKELNPGKRGRPAVEARFWGLSGRMRDEGSGSGFRVFDASFFVQERAGRL